MFEVLFELFGELLLQIAGELLVEFGMQSLAEPFRRKPNPWLAALGCAIFGALAGGLSLLVFPNHLTPKGWLRTANLFFTPLLAGGTMAALSAWRVRRGRPELWMDRFLFGFVFAAAMAAVRFRFAN